MSKNNIICPNCGEHSIVNYQGCCSLKCFSDYCFKHALSLDVFLKDEQEETINQLQCEIEDLKEELEDTHDKINSAILDLESI